MFSPEFFIGSFFCFFRRYGDFFQQIFSMPGGPRPPERAGNFARRKTLLRCPGCCVPCGALYTGIRYAVTPCADTAHTPERVKELAAMKRIIVLALLTFLCLALRASSRMQVKQRPPSGWHRAEAKTKRHPLNTWSAYNAPCPSGWCWSTGPTPFL